VPEPSDPPPPGAVFLDRDGVIIADIHHVRDPAKVTLLPGAAAAIARLNARAIPVIVVTNQSGVARGLFGEDDLAAIHRRLEILLAAVGAHVDAIHYCPHHPEIGEAPYRRACECRKPAPGLLLRGARARDVAPEECVMVGDQPTDIAAGQRAGCRMTILVDGDVRGGQDQRDAVRPDHVVADLAAAVALILGETARP